MMQKEQIEKAVRQHSDMLYRIALMRTGNAEEAQDMVQQTFLKLVEHYDELDSEEHMKAWLIRVCCNHCYNLMKAPWKYKRADEAMLPEISDHSESGEQKALQKLKYEALWREVCKLPEKYRMVLHLQYMEEYSPGEIADILKLDYNTVCVRLNRAKKLLAKRLDKEEFWNE